MPPLAKIIISLLYLTQSANAIKLERKLYDELLSPKRYNKLIRPRASGDGPTIVYLGLRLSQFINVDERKEVMRTLVWLEQEWQEPLLSWVPKKYGNIQSIHIPAEELWRPDIVLYNNVNGKYKITTMTRAEVFFNGTVRWMPPALYLSACRIDMEHFPYDEQTCSMRFGSWTYDGSKVELRHHLQKFVPELHRPIYIDYAADLHDFESTIEYDIIYLSAICANNFYQHSVHPYPEINFKLRMHRRYTFYTFNLLFPCVGIAILASRCTVDGEVFALYNCADYLIDFLDGGGAECSLQIGEDPFYAKLLKSVNDHSETDVIKNRWVMNKNGLMNYKSEGLLSAAKEEKNNFLACQITRQLVEQCSDETQLRIRNKLHQVADGSKFIEQQLNAIEMESNIEEEWKFVALVMDRTCSIMLGSQTLWVSYKPLTPHNLPQIANLTSFLDAEMIIPNKTVGVLLPIH
ncbi:hypothetical protein ACTXT7_006658 [Hymenolepis weldensis]